MRHALHWSLLLPYLPLSDVRFLRKTNFARQLVKQRSFEDALTQKVGHVLYPLSANTKPSRQPFNLKRLKHDKNVL